MRVATRSGGLRVVAWWLMAVCVLAPSRAVAAEPTDWQDAGESAGVTLETRINDSGYREYRGSVTVCTDLDELQRFVSDVPRLEEWIPHTEEARALPRQGSGWLYYLRSRTPWPFKSRDMVYRLDPLTTDEPDTIAIDITGVPGAAPEVRGAVRMHAAQGRWTLTRLDGHVRVALRLGVDAGRVPGFLADRRLSGTVAGSLANLAAEFPCWSP